MVVFLVTRAHHSHEMQPNAGEFQLDESYYPQANAWDGED
jgi:hypothetical protein